MKIRHKLISEDKGKERVRVRFALLPVRLTNGDLIWLDTYNHVERVIGDSDDDRWETESKKAIDNQDI